MLPLPSTSFDGFAGDADEVEVDDDDEEEDVDEVGVDVLAQRTDDEMMRATVRGARD